MQVNCDESITGVGEGKIIGVDFIYPWQLPESEQDNEIVCNPRVTVAHKDGCPTATLLPARYFIQQRIWTWGIFLTVGSAFTGLCGLRFFTPIAATLASVFVGLLCMYLAFIFEFTITVLGLILSIVVSVLLLVLTFIVVYKTIWLQMGLLGAFGGFFGGSLLYTTFLGEILVLQVWGYFMITLFFAIIGLLISFKYGKEIVLISTSLLSSNLFTRGTSCFFPTKFLSFEQQIEAAYGNFKVELNWQFWTYIGEMVLVAFIFAAVQIKTQYYASKRG